MKSYIVSYDLNAPGQNYESLYKELDKYQCCRILESTWIVRTEKTAVQLRDAFLAVMDRNDNIFVSKTEGAAWKLLKPANDWLEANL